MVDAAFWASLRREEGQTPRISLAFVSPEQANHALTFAVRLPLVPAILASAAVPGLLPPARALPAEQ